MVSWAVASAQRSNLGEHLGQLERDPLVGMDDAARSRRRTRRAVKITPDGESRIASNSALPSACPARRTASG